MSAGLQIAIYGAMIVAVVLLNLFGVRGHRQRRDPDALGVALMILLIWVVSRVVSVLLSQDMAMRLWPLMDFVALCTCLLAWRTSKRPDNGWKLLLAFTYLFQLADHAKFWTPPPIVDKTTYILALNLLFIAQLMIVGWQGLRDGFLASGARPWLLLRGRPGHRPDG